MTRRINYYKSRIFAHKYRAQKMYFSNDERAAERQAKIREKCSSVPEGRRKKVQNLCNYRHEIHTSFASKAKKIGANGKITTSSVLFTNEAEHCMWALNSSSSYSFKSRYSKENWTFWDRRFLLNTKWKYQQTNVSNFTHVFFYEGHKELCVRNTLRWLVDNGYGLLQ